VSEAPATRDYDADAKGPLDGVRVLDLSRLVAGNMLSLVLADFGAEVIKIERPGLGDDLRHWKVDGISAHWKVFARNKKSVALNLRHEEGRALLLRLVESAAVLIENYIPGTLEKMGLGPEILHARNPKLVVVRVSGWGQSGPFRNRPGFGSLVEAMSGFASLNGYPDRPPVLPPVALADMIAGLYGAFATLTALREVELKDGPGQIVDLSLFESIFSFFGQEALTYQLSGAVKQRVGSRSNTTAPRNVYRCKDGKYVALSASMQSMAERLFRSIGRADLVDDPRFRTNADRVANLDEVDGIVAEYMARHTQAENVAHFELAGVTVGPVCDIADLLTHPYILGREILQSFPDDEVGELPMHHVTPRLSGTPGSIRSPAPGIGEHTFDILSGLGIPDGELDRFAKEGIIA
jgi:crotonobetainyl-CoA:carnitine CoA-transferase CaiB-like acyl-CoA transferase